ncbi:extracellular solute-binding protein [Vallitalea pronyensis]|uniref:Extracellular solute-binding protein n=1 Tax=Vallitalea pronyensis TaxID=1348613 RepID=A0A8J8MNG0_9FIRM|nr:extracellular solute-binding protein [Vallitalea pronyensis]QUI24637.1 extracellular solute-binding protein [Vallitalea pronyensis]
MKKKNLSRFLTWLCVAVLIVSVFTACSSKEDSNEKQSTSTADAKKEDSSDAVVEDSTTGIGWKDYADDDVKFTWYLNFSWFPNQWGVDDTSQYITEKTGVDIEFIVPAGNEAEKINAMIASNTLPDIVTLGWWEPQVNTMIEGGLVHALDTLAEAYDPYFFKVADPAKLGWYAKEDGHTYGYPNASYTPSDYEKYDTIYSNETFLVRKDMYEAIGSPDMSTPEGFLQALRDVKEMFPVINNQPIIPFGLQEFTDIGNASIDKMLPNFLAIPKEKDGKVYEKHDRAFDPDMVTWLKTFRQAYSEGLLMDDVFIDKRIQMEEKIAQGRYFCMLYQGQDALAPIKSLYDENPEQQYIAIHGPKNSKGDDPTLGATGVAGWTLTFISKNCKNPERAIQFMSYLMSEEGQHDTYLGAPSNYHTVDGKDTFKPEVLELMNTDRAAFDQQYGGENTFWMFMDLAIQSQWNPPLTEPIKQFKEWTSPYVTWMGQFDDIYPPSDSDIGADYLKIDNKWGQVLPQLLMAKSDDELDKQLEAFLSYRDENNFKEIVTYQQEKVDTNKEKLGIK